MRDVLPLDGSNTLKAAVSDFPWPTESFVALCQTSCNEGNTSWKLLFKDYGKDILDISSEVRKAACGLPGLALWLSFVSLPFSGDISATSPQRIRILWSGKYRTSRPAIPRCCIRRRVILMIDAPKRYCSKCDMPLHEPAYQDRGTCGRIRLHTCIR